MSGIAKIEKGGVEVILKKPGHSWIELGIGVFGGGEDLELGLSRKPSREYTEDAEIRKWGGTAAGKRGVWVVMWEQILPKKKRELQQREREAGGKRRRDRNRLSYETKSKGVPSRGVWRSKSDGKLAARKKTMNNNRLGAKSPWKKPGSRKRGSFRRKNY